MTIGRVSRLAVITTLLLLPVVGNAQKPAITFDICTRDEAADMFLQVNTTTGGYFFSECDVVTLAGVGGISPDGSGGFTFQFKNGAFKGLFSLNSSQDIGFVDDSVTGKRVPFENHNRKGDVCACQ